MMTSSFPAYPAAHRTTRLLLLVLVQLTFVNAAGAAEPLVASNAMALVDGKPRFILGLYENPKEDAALKAAVAAGFNLIQCDGSKASLDRLHAHGVKAWTNLGGNLDLSTDSEARQARLLALVNSIKDHPALLVWEGPDEALWNAWYADGLEYFESSEFPAMSAAIEKARADKKPGSDLNELDRLLKHGRELFARGLWAGFDAQRAEFWKRAGKNPPRSDIKMAERSAASRRLGDGLARGIETVRQADPRHLIWLNHAPRNSIESMAYFNRAADMAGCDIYPAPAKLDTGHSDLFTGWLTSVGAYTDRMRAAAPSKSCAMVLQGFGWRDLDEAAKKKPATTDVGRRPNYQESRFMAYDAVVHGANAILYWGTAYIEKDSQLWKDLLRLAGELHAIETALAAPSVEPFPTAHSDEVPGSVDGGGLRPMLKRVGEDYVLLVVNETPHGLPFEIKGLPAGLEGRTLYRLGSDEAATVKGASLRDGMLGFDVHVYATSRAFEPKR
jgi:hypothetical protein